MSYAKALSSAKTLRDFRRGAVSSGFQRSHMSEITAHLRRELEIIEDAVVCLPASSSPRIDAMDGIARIREVLDALEKE